MREIKKERERERERHTQTEREIERAKVLAGLTAGRNRNGEE